MLVGYRAPNCQQLMDINLFEDSSYVLVVTLFCGDGFIQNYAAFSYNTRENREEGSPASSRLGVFLVVCAYPT